MLKYLSITNYALIDHLEIDFSDGFSAITGETGAGKSIILGALSLILGNRADLNNIKNQNSKCIIEGVFDNGGLQLSEYFLNNDLDLEAETILRRELLPSGKSRAFVNDTPVNLKMLGYLGNRFVNIHSQHQTLQLTDSLFQLEVLDDFVKNTELNLDYKDVFEEYQVLNQRLAELKELSQKSSRDEDYIKFQLDELNSHTLDPEIIQDLENRAKVLEHSEDIKLAISEAEYLLNDGETSLLNNMSKLKRVLDNVREYLPTNTDLTDRLNSILIELEDIGSDINSMSSNDDFDPSELQSINDSLSGIYTLLKKHHVVSVDELVELRDDFDNRLQGIESVDDNITATESKISSLEKRLTLLSNKLSTKRQEGAKDFAGSVLQKLKQLGMQDSNFVVSISKKDKFTSTGRDNVQLLFNANKGIEPGEISKIASGGELSRLMLAIKSLINQKQMLPTVIFDEIDSGVSGDIAGKVGKIMKEMANKHQIITITHLPQIASKAKNHYKVFKVLNDDSTNTTIEMLSEEGRVEELATMLSSERVTETAMNVAREMINDH